MNSSSAQESYSITYTDTISDVITITGSDLGYDPTSCHTITLPTTPSVTYTSGASYTIGSGLTVGGISTIDISSIQITLPIEWENSWPEWSRIEKMCEEYPALKIAFEKFKTTYKLVRDDYDTPPEKRIKP